jgi:hypothetical protein
MAPVTGPNVDVAVVVVVDVDVNLNVEVVATVAMDAGLKPSW